MARVVMLDQDDEFLALIGDILGALGHQAVSVAPSTADAAAIVAQSPELLIVDLNPGRVLARLRLVWALRRSGHRELRVLAISDDLSVLRRYRRVWKELGVVTLRKPFDLDDFQERIGRLVQAA